MRRFGLVALMAGLFGFVLPISAQEAADKPKEKLEHTDAEKAAMAEIRKLGGHVMELAQTDPHLEVAYHLTDGDVGDDHLKPLANMPLLVSVNLRGTKITNAGLAHLKGVKSLKRLHLEKTTVTDEGLAFLAGLENLEYLNLYGTKITDEGLQHLASLKKLKKLYLWQTNVSESGVQTLKTALPALEVDTGIEEAAIKAFTAVTEENTESVN